MSDVKKVNADNWGRTSENYAQRAHKGPGMMMPLIARYTEASIIAPTYGLLPHRRKAPDIYVVRVGCKDTSKRA